MTLWTFKAFGAAVVRGERLRRREAQQAIGAVVTLNRLNGAGRMSTFYRMTKRTKIQCLVVSETLAAAGL